MANLSEGNGSRLVTECLLLVGTYKGDKDRQTDIIRTNANRHVLRE